MEGKDMILLMELDDREKVNRIYADLTQGISEALGWMDLLRVNLAVNVLEEYVKYLKESPEYCPDVQKYIKEAVKVGVRTKRVTKLD